MLKKIFIKLGTTLLKKGNPNAVVLLDESDTVVKQLDTGSKYASIVNSARDFMTLIDRNYAYRIVNNAYCKAHKLRREQILGKTIQTIWGNKIFNSFLKNKLDACFAGEKVKYEDQFRFGARGLTHMQVTCYPFYEEKKITHAIVVSHEITKFKLAERKLRELANKLSVSDKTKEQFLANMSHELRTPMNAVIGMANVLLESGLTEEQREWAATIKYSGNMLVNVVDSILDFSKLEEGKLDLNPVDFSLRDVVKNISANFILETQTKSVELKTNVHDDIPDILYGDVTRLQQILMNLLSNATKFTQKGSIILSVKKADEEEEEEKKQEEKKQEEFDLINLRFAVTDTGIGISDEKRHLLFQRFSQIDGNSNRKFGGSGLGLTISKHLVMMMGGEIGVNSKEGEGSEFFFTLSLPEGKGKNKPHEVKKIKNSQSILKRIIEKTATKKGSKQNKKEESKLAQDLEDTGKRILLVEDNISNQRLALLLLKKRGWKQVDIANHGKEALEKLENQKYHLILMDIQMPVMDGIETTKIIREKYPEPVIPIIGLTANVLIGDREKYLAAGMNEYVSKPIQNKILYKKIEEMFEKYPIHLENKAK